MWNNANVVGILWCLLAGVASTGATYLLRVSHLQSETACNPLMFRLFYSGMAVGSYGIGFIFYSLALKKLPMSFAYPMMTACTIILVSVVGAFWMQEPMGTMKLIGVAMIMCGAFILAM